MIKSRLKNTFASAIWCFLFLSLAQFSAAANPPSTNCNCYIIINSSSSCAGSNSGSATAQAFDGRSPYTYRWSNGASGASVTGLASGTYRVTSTDKDGCTATQSVTISSVSLNVDAGANKTICKGSSTQLNATGADLYSWTPTTGLSNASIANPIASPTVTTTYTVTGAVSSGELVTNGNFESGNTGFTSQYTYNSDLYPEGRYFVGSNANNNHNNFFGTGRGGTGKFMIINGATVAGVDVWKQTVTVTPNTTYYFSTWITALNNLVSANLAFKINGTLIGPVISSPTSANTWIQFYAVWNSGSATSATISIVNQNTIANGNDFGLDDISFTTVCEKTDQVTVTVNNTTASAGSDKVSCPGESVTLTATGGGSYAWSTGATTASITVNPTSTTTYTVTVTNNGCSDTDEVEVAMSQSCPDWEFDCANRKVEIVGKGAKGNTSTTLNFTNTSNIDSIVIEAVCKNSPLPTSATFTSNNGQTITTTNRIGVINGNGNQGIFRVKMNAASSISVSTNQPNQTYSIVAYVYRSGTGIASGGSGIYTNAYIYRNTITYTLNVPATSSAKNLTLTIPFTEMTNDSRVANISATAGSVTNSTSINTYNLGNSLNIVTLPLNNVPGNVTAVSVTITSPNSNGDSFLNGVSVSTESCCTPITASISKVDAGCKPDTTSYCTLTLATSQHGLWLDDIPSSPSKYHKIVGGSLTATKYSDGRLHITGTFENVSDANRKWTLDVMYTNKMNWADWSAAGGSWKGQAGNVGNNYLDWDYYKMDVTYSNKLTGSGTYAGKVLNLTHMPSNYFYGFQVGLGANDQTADWGMSGWFEHTGSYTGNGDINFDAVCDSSVVSLASSCNGTADLSVSGGAAPYTYLWSNGRTSQDVNGLCAGSYTVTITDAYGCTSTKSVTIGTTSDLSVTCNSTNVTTQGGTNGTASVTVTGGVSPYTYLWSTGHTTQSVTNRPAGVYSVTVTDKNGCFVEYECCIKQPSVCDGFRTQTQGGWGASPSGGNPGTYVHANFNSAFPSGLTVGCATGFTLKLTSAQAVTDFLPSGSTARALTANLTNPGGSYNNVLAGQVVALALSVGFDNANPSFGPNATPLQDLVLVSGTFANWTVAQVLAEANKKLGGCSSSYSLSQLNDAVTAINENYVDGNNTGNYLKCGLDLVTVKVDVKCYGQSTGSIDLSVSGGMTPYTYAWSNGAITQDLTNVPAGTYTVTVTDAYGLTATSSATVSQPNQLSVSINKTDLNCNGVCTGSASATVTGGTAPYTYKWNNNATTASLNNLCAGTYTVTVTDANNCTTTKTTTLTQPNALVSSITKTDVSCGGGNIPCQLFQYAPSGHAVYLPNLGLSSSNWVFGSQGGTIETYANGTARIYGNIYFHNDTTKSFFLDFHFSNKMNWAQWSALGRSWKGNANVVGSNYQNWSYYIFDPNTASTLTGRNSYLGNNLNITHNPSNYQYGLQIGLAANDKNGNYGLSTWFSHTGWKTGNGDINANLVCVQGQCDGTTDVTVTGGTAPYTYSWSTGATSEDLNSLCPGTYNVTVTDSKGCTKVLTATILEGSELLVTATGTNIACAGVCNGTATVSATGGNTPLTYAWSNGSTAQSLTGLCAGTYIVTVTDRKGCFGMDTVVISANPKPEIAAVAADVNCFGGATGTVTTTVTGGTSPFTYAWSPSGETTANLANKPAGTFTVILTDVNGCKDTASATITQPADSLNGTTSSTPVSCIGGADGTASVVATGGTAPYTYAWSTTPTRTTAAITGLRVGAYSVTITDAKGCTIVRTVTVTGVPPLTVGSVPSPVLCNGGNTGSINLTVNGGTPGYTFQWSNGATTEDISGLTAGNYNVTVTDANGCVATAGVSVTQPQPIVATATPINVNCNGASTGKVTLSVTGGTSPFVYAWSNGATTKDLNNIAAGTYSVTITDANSCTATASATVTQKDSIKIVTTDTHVSCTGGATGSITTAVTGGTSPFSYLWSNGATTANLSGLSAGTFYLTVTDANGCTALDTTAIVQRDSIDIIVDTIINATCYGDSGSVTITVTGGTPVCTPGTFTPTTTCTACTQTISGNQQNIFITAGQKVCVLPGTTFTGSLNMSGGELVICGTANPSNFSTTGGTITVIGSLNANVINLETALTILNYGSISTATNITGNGKLYNYGNISVSGDLDINSNGGLFENYGITRVSNNLNNSATTLNNGSIFISNTLQNNGGATFTNNCNLTASVNFINNSLFHNNGQIVVGVTTYLNGGSTLNMGVGAQHSTQHVHLNGLLHGPATACASFKVSDNSTINGSGVVNGNISYCDLNGIETNTGTINNGASLSCSCLASNPNNSYTYTVTWSTGDTTTTVNGLPAGTYTVTVTDASGCKAIETVVINQPDSLTATISKTDVSCSANCDGTASLSGVSGGTAPYTYAWSNGATTQNVTALCGGIYTVTITDSKGCKLTKSVVITARPLLQVSATANPVNCFGGANGSVTTIVTGGTSPFTYSWNPGGETTANLTSKPAGTYGVTVTDTNGCSATASTAITQPADSLNGNTSSTPVSCIGGTDGTASVVATGGTAPYTYAWSTIPSRTTATITGLRVGSYTVTITDANACNIVRTVVVTGVPPLTVGSVPSPVLCNGGSTGSINLTVSGGTPTYTFQWSNGATTEDISGLTAGSYNVTVTDANGCVATAGVTVTEPQPLVATATPQHIACFGANTGGVTLSVVGGSSPFTYAWSNGATTKDLTGLTAGTYTVTVTDKSNCTATASASVNQQAALTVTATPTDVTCYGFNNGSIATTVGGGVAPYTYNWGAGQPTTANRSNLAPGSYSVTVSDANGCSSTASATITQPADSLNGTTSSTPVSCIGGTDGTASAVATGGTAPYTYAWSTIPSRTTATITGLRVGSYTVTITDANACNIVRTVVVTGVPPLTVGSVPSPVLCNGGSTGSINLTVSGGTPNYTFQWSNGATTEDISGLTAGSYNVTVTDANGCVATAGVTVTEPQPLVATATPQHIACFGANTGGVTLSVVGGSSPFTYAWSNGATTKDLTGLTAGTYTVTVTDKNNCTATASATVTQQSALVVNVTGNNLACYNNNSGSATANVTGGVAPYTYLWSNNSTASAISNLPIGTYSVTVTDANNCTGTGTVTLTQPDSLVASISASALACNGDTTATITLLPAGGNAPYTYLWNTGATTQNLTNLGAGTYTVTITDANGCALVKTAVVTQPNLLVANATPLHIACNGAATGGANLAATGGTLPYTYLWSNGDTTQNLSGVTAGTYSVTVTDANGCSDTASATINQQAALQVIATPTNITCYGLTNGSIATFVNGGVAPYTYNWGNGITTANRSNLAPGTYTVTVSDANNCTGTASATITQPADSLNGTTSSTPVSCIGGTDGTASVVATGGTAPYTYAWSTIPVRTSSTITGLRVGTYTVTITDANACNIVRTVVVTGVPPLTLGSVPSPVLCNGGSTGSINLTVSGGTPGYTFLWSNGATTEDISGLTAGNYNVTVTDANGCVATAGVTVTEPQPLVATATPQHIACFGANTGGVTLSVVGGSSPFTYAWSNGAITKDLSGLTAGTYSVTITDKNNCTATASATVNQQSALSVTVVGTDLTCYANRSGSATATVSGGVAPYTYVWSNGGNTDSLTNLPIGTYAVTVTDANGCTGTGSATISQPDTLTATAVGSAVSCFGNTTGTVTLTVTGGTAAYTYIWSNGDTTKDLSGLAAGSYTVTVTDANGCTATASATVTQPALLTAAATGSAVSCFGDATGTVTLTVTGGTTAYSYAWSNGSVTKDLSGLAAGTYTVTVTDANGCSATASATVTEPALLTATGTNTNVLCNAGTNATATLTVSGGTAPYTYLWSNGATTQNLANLGAGTYTVTVTDANGCTATKSYTVTQPATLTASATAQDVRCFLGSDGSVNSTVTGGVGPYTYRWSNNATTANLTALRAGSFTVTVTDANGCTATATAVVGQPGPLTLGGLPSPVLCNGGSTGSINLTTTGGVPPYTFIWSNGATTEDISNLTAGMYNVTVTDANNCVATVGVNVLQPAVITLSFVGVNVTTNGGSDGSIDLSVVGGTSPFTYAWSNGATTQDLANIPAGNYCVTVTDVNGCTATGCKTITEPACTGFSASATGTNVNCNGGNNGTATATVTGGVAPYSYVWSNGATTQNLTGLAAGTYTVTVTDAVSCVSTANVTITQPTTLTAAALGTNPACNGQASGSIALNVSGGTSPITYAWSNGATTQNLSGLAGGAYTVTVTDANGCTATSTAFIAIPASISIAPVVTQVRCFLGNDGSVSITVTGGISPYTYRWSNNATTRNITALRAGTYTVTVTDANGCTATSTSVVTQPGPLTLGGSPSPVSCFQGNDGSINLTATGGTAPYNFTWSNGATTEDISGLAAGTYNVTVTDARGCVGTVAVTVLQPAAIVLSANVTDACGGGNSGALQLNVVGGTSPYTYIWSNGATTKNIGSLAPGSYAVTVTDSKGCVASSSFSVGSNINCRTMEFTIDVFLEGPYETQNMLMQNKLRTQCNTVPLFQPYNNPATGYNGTESVGSLGNDVVDWVLVSFRFTEDKNSEIYKTAALLGRDGKVRTITGDTIFQVNASATDSLYVVVEHRNHMGVMTPAKMCADHANGNGVICVDFTHMQSFVTGSPATAGQKVLGADNHGTVYGMHSGDGDSNFDINSSDFVPFGTDFNKFYMYSPGDFNMDCDCNSNDLPLWLGNFNQFSGVR